MSNIFDQIGINRQKPLGELPGDLGNSNLDQVYRIGGQIPPDVNQQSGLLQSSNMPTSLPGQNIPKMATFVQSSFDTRPINSQEFILQAQPAFTSLAASSSNLGTEATSNAPFARFSAFVPSENKLFVRESNSNNSAGKVAVYDLTNGSLIATIALGSGFGTTVDSKIIYVPSVDRVYVLDGVAGVSTAISVINPATNAIVASIAIPGIDNLNSLLYVSDTDRIYALDQTGTVRVINPNTNAITATVAGVTGGTLGSSNPTMAYCPVNQSIYVVDYSTLSNIAVFSTVTNTVTATLATSTLIDGVMYAPSSNRVYAYRRNGVNIFAIANNGTMITIPGGAEKMIYNNNDGNLYGVQSGNFFRLNTTTNAIDLTVFHTALLSGAVGMAYNPSANTIYIVDGGDAIVSNFSLDTLAFGADIIYTTAGFNNPISHWVDFSTVTNQLFVTWQDNANNVSVSSINPSGMTFRAVASFTVPDGRVAVVRDFRYDIDPLINYDMSQVTLRFDINGAVVPFHDVIRLGGIVDSPQETHIIAGPKEVINVTLTVGGALVTPATLNVILHGQFLQSRGLPPNYEIGSV